MPRGLTTPLHLARYVLNQDAAWLMFVEIPTADGLSAFRLCTNNTHTVFGAYVWTAASMSIELPEENADGSLGRASIQISNVSRIPMALIEQAANGSQFGELLGQQMTIYLANESSLQDARNSVRWRQLITNATATEQTLRLDAMPPAESMRVPRPIYDRTTFRQLLPPGVR